MRHSLFVDSGGVRAMTRGDDGESDGNGIERSAVKVNAAGGILRGTPEPSHDPKHVEDSFVVAQNESPRWQLPFFAIERRDLFPFFGFPHVHIATDVVEIEAMEDRKSTRLNSSHSQI